MSDSTKKDLALPYSAPSFYTGSDIAKATPVRPSTFNKHYQDLYDNEEYLLQMIQGVKQSIDTLKSKLESMQTQINTMSDQLTDLIQNPQYNIATLEESQNIANPSNEVLMSPMRTLQLLARLGITLNKDLNTVVNCKKDDDPVLS